jgi:putative peptide zinc metalloprotease protein
MPHTPEIQSRWKHVAQLRPRLRRHVRLYPQQYRGDRWYVLQDESSGRYLRVNAAAYEIIGRMDGDLTVQEIWDQISTVLGDEGLGDEGLSQDDLIDILAQLYAANVLTTGVRPDTQQLFRHHLQRPYWRRALLNPLALRVRLLDPDRMLTYLSGLARPAFSSAGLAIWLVVVGAASLLALVHSAEIVDAISGGAILSPQNLLLVSLAYLAMKVLHELGHGIAVKIWGGEVHDMGITLLVLMPVPYVDASAAWGFQDKRRRAVVGAAGILVEIFLAALGLFVWLAVEPGTVRDAALDVALIGGVSTLLFNGNPLLRFDA